MLTWLLACNVVIDEGSFFDDYPERICSLGVSCLWPEMPPTVEACVESRQEILQEKQDTCGAFNKDEAAICMRALDDITCDDLEYQYADADPSSCAYVYDCSDTSIGTTYY